MKNLLFTTTFLLIFSAGAAQAAAIGGTGFSDPQLPPEEGIELGYEWSGIITDDNNDDAAFQLPLGNVADIVENRKSNAEEISL